VNVTVRTAGRGETRRLVFMAVVAVLLGAVVAANLAEQPGATEDPRASFTFEADNESVLVTHYGGDEIDPGAVYVESGTRGRLGSFDGSAGAACTRNVTRVTRGTTCRVPNATYERLYVVWEGADNRTLILDRRAPDPTPTPTPTPVPTATATPTTPTPTVPATTTVTPATPGTATETLATPTGTGTPATPGTPDGTVTVTAGPNGTVTPADGTPTETPTGEPAG
jgi:hypothetical protein